MNNADQPAMPMRNPNYDGNWDKRRELGGLTKRECFCLEMGVPETGDDELDAIIRAGVRQRHAAMAMQGLLAAEASEMDYMGEVAYKSVQLADVLLANLE